MHLCQFLYYGNCYKYSRYRTTKHISSKYNAYICIYIYIYINIHIYRYINIYMHIYICIYIYMYIRIHIWNLVYDSCIFRWLPVVLWDWERLPPSVVGGRGRRRALAVVVVRLARVRSAGGVGGCALVCQRRPLDNGVSEELVEWRTHGVDRQGAGESILMYIGGGEILRRPRAG